MICPQCLLSAHHEGRNSDITGDSTHKLPELRNLLSKKGLKILHQNIRGLTTNKQLICEILESFSNIDIFSLSETHMNENSNAQAHIQGYTLVSKPRATGDGGGVGAYISQNIPFARQIDLETSDVECIWLEILYPFCKVIIALE